MLISMYRNKRFYRETCRLHDYHDKIKYCDENIIVLFFPEIGEIQIHNTVDYPFKKPNVMINGRDYIRSIRDFRRRFDKTCKKLLNVCCMVCNSQLCDHNWNVSITMKMIINEVIENQTKKQKMINHILIKSIKQNNNIPMEIDILSFLS